MSAVLQKGHLVDTFPKHFLVLEEVSAIYNFPKQEAAVSLWEVLPRSAFLQGFKESHLGIRDSPQTRGWAL